MWREICGIGDFALMVRMTRLFAFLTNQFAALTVIGTVWAWFYPSHFEWFITGQVGGVKYINIGLGLIMFGMGITLRPEDFRGVLKMPRAVGIGVASQFLVMPFLGFAIAKGFQLEEGLAVGLILVSCCPGGTASNVVTYLARANLPLSVLLTMCSTMVSIALTPLLTGWLAGAYVEINRMALFLDMIAVVLVPVLAGIFFNRLAPKAVRFVTPWSPLLSVVIIVMIVGGIIGLSKELIMKHAGVLLLAVLLLHAGGFALGYLLAKLFGFGEAERRTLSIEVGMQNSGLGSSLAKADKFRAQFTSPEQALLAPVPCAISALYHCIIGSFLASIWRRSENTNCVDNVHTDG
jgi:BASS family bile acid:Na+ symporter